MRLAHIVFIAGLGLGCVTGRSAMSLKELEVAPLRLMVAKRSARPLYLVLDPRKVPNALPVLVDGEHRGGELVEVETFVTRDLKSAFLTYFDTVEVVSPQQLPKTGSFVVGEVRLDRLEVLLSGHRQISGYAGMVQMRSGAALLNWGFGLRLSESDDYLYSFAASSVGQPGEDSTVVFRTTFESAVNDLFRGYTDKQVHQAVLAAGSAPAVAPGTSL